MGLLETSQKIVGSPYLGPWKNKDSPSEKCPPSTSKTTQGVSGARELDPETAEWQAGTRRSISDDWLLFPSQQRSSTGQEPDLRALVEKIRTLGLEQEATAQGMQAHTRIDQYFPSDARLDYLE
jgi:hypothetical protein